MSRKKKSKPASAVSGSPDSAALAGQAHAALTAARFKEAIENFKELLKRERHGAWLEGLAAAYAGRAEQLAAKGMVKEALALWRTRSDACGVPLLGGSYVAWLLKDGQVAQALGHLDEVDKMPPELQAAAQAQLAAAVLVAPDPLLAGLPADSPLLRHRAAARAALNACVQDDETALEQALQAISFRSPYRDLRPLLKALVLQAKDPQLAAAALARVPEEGPFKPLAAAVRVYLLPGIEWLAGLRQLDEAGRALVLQLKGCPPSQQPLVLDLTGRLGETATGPLELFDIVLRHRRAMDDGMARRVCLRLLAHAPQRQGAFRTAFLPLTPAEEEHTLALAAELKQRPDQAETHWLRLVRVLGSTPAGKQRAALVLRRLADEHAHHSGDGALCSHALDWLEQSLELDPADRATHLRLIRDARKSGELKQARTWLDAARKRFPDDTPLLLEAVEVALAGGAFKKAAGLAKQVLKGDPINPQVRTVIGQAHLAHARKQVDANNPQAARRELDEAANWLRGAGERGLVSLLRSFVAESTQAGDSLLREAVAQFGSPVVGAFHLLRESKRAKLEPRDLLRRAEIDLAATPSASDVVALAHALNAVPERDGGLRTAFAMLHPLLERAARVLQFPEHDHLLVCEALHRHGQRDLTRRFAEAAVKRWPQRLVFVYLDAAARFAAEPWRMPQRERQRLDRVFDQARAQGDQRTASRLGRLLDAGGFVSPGEDGPGDLDEFGADDIRAVMDMMLAFGGEDSFLAMARQRLGKAVFEQLRREIGGSKKQFAQALVELLTLGEPEPTRPARTGPPAANNQTGLFDD